MATNIIKYQIANLNPTINNAFITCIIINKSDVKVFSPKMDETQSRGVITFTVRDATRFCNCTVWGADIFINEIDQKFRYGDIINIMYPDISQTNMNQTFLPITSSPYTLTMKQAKGGISKFDGDQSDYLPLLKVPLKSTQMILNLKDVDADGKQSIGKSVDILVAVRVVKPIKQVQLKTGEIKECREIIVMDQTFAGMSLNIWRKNLIERSNSWQAGFTILHILSARTEYSDFYRSTTIGVNTRTLIIEDPISDDAYSLSRFALNVPLSNIDIEQATSSSSSSKTSPAGITSTFDNEPNINISEITNVMTIRQIKDRCDGKLFSDDDQFTAVVYGLITHFDLDGSSKILAIRCSRCKKQLFTEECENVDCIVSQYGSSGQTVPRTIENFELNIGISDHTDTIKNCRLIGAAAERMLGHTVESFKLLNDIDRGVIKCEYLLERCKIKLLIKRKSILRQQTFIQIVDCGVADETEVTNKIKVY